MKAGKLARMALEQTHQLLEQFGPRLSGSEGASGCAEALKEELGKYCDSAECEREKISSGAFYAWPKVMIVLYIAVLVLLFAGLPVTALVVLALLSAAVVAEYLFYSPVIEKVFGTTEACNVWGSIEPESGVEQTLILSAHLDSARVSADSGAKLKSRVKIALCFLILVLFTVSHLIWEISNGLVLSFNLPSLIRGILLIIPVAGIREVLKLRGVSEPEVSYGAGDNLVSCCALCSLSRYFRQKVEQNQGLKNTRLVFVCFDGEECGARGSRAFFARHSFENCRMINLDTVSSSDSMLFVDRDVNGTRPLSEELARDMVALARSMGYRAKTAAIPVGYGGSDASSAAKAGIEAVTVTSLSWGDSVIHTMQDTEENIDIHGVEAAISIVIKYVQRSDCQKVSEQTAEITPVS